MYWLQQVRVYHIETLSIKAFVDDLDLLLSKLLIELMRLGVEDYLLHLLCGFFSFDEFSFQALQLELALV